jgi:hypothetical protein
MCFDEGYVMDINDVESGEYARFLQQSFDDHWRRSPLYRLPKDVPYQAAHTAAGTAWSAAWAFLCKRDPVAFLKLLSPPGKGAAKAPGALPLPADEFWERLPDVVRKHTSYRDQIDGPHVRWDAVRKDFEQPGQKSSPPVVSVGPGGIGHKYSVEL